MLEPGVPGAPRHPGLEVEEEEEELGRGKEQEEVGGWRPPGLGAPAVGECGGSTLTTLLVSR